VTNFQVGDLIRATRDSEWSWGDSFKEGDQFFVGHPNTLHYFKYIKNEDKYFEKVDVETYGRHHTDFVDDDDYVMHIEEACICRHRGMGRNAKGDYHGRHRYEDDTVHHLRFLADNCFSVAWR
jgi:hypothetical protein